MKWNRDKALKHLRSRAKVASQNSCAEFTKQAIEAGGITLHRTNNAKNFSASLSRAGFAELPADTITIAGDIVVIQPHGEDDSIGHMAMFDGSIWISDFRQRAIYPDLAYRQAQPLFTLYRMP